MNSPKPTSLKSRFTRGFLKALIKIKTQRQSTSSSRRVKIAADKSMALAVGSKRAWSRAMLWKIQNKARRRNRNSLIMRSRSSIYNHQIKIPIRKIRRLKEIKKQDSGNNFSETKQLRKLVPGGEAMDICNLLDETAHYIKCLVTQVQVMRNIDQLYSTNT